MKKESRTGDSPDPVFEDDEQLYRPIPGMVRGRHPTVLAFGKPPPFSVNRSKYSEPMDVVKGYEGWGVAKAQVVRVKKLSAASESMLMTVAIEHAPERGNYAHSEIRVFQNGEESAAEDLDETLMTTLRAELARSFFVHKQIEPAEDHSA